MSRNNSKLTESAKSGDSNAQHALGYLSNVPIAPSTCLGLDTDPATLGQDTAAISSFCDELTKAGGRVVPIVSLPLNKQEERVRQLTEAGFQRSNVWLVDPYEENGSENPYFGNWYRSFLLRRVQVAEILDVTHYIDSSAEVKELFEQFLPKVVFIPVGAIAPPPLPNPKPSRPRPAIPTEGVDYICAPGMIEPIRVEYSIKPPTYTLPPSAYVEAHTAEAKVNKRASIPPGSSTLSPLAEIPIASTTCLALDMEMTFDSAPEFFASLATKVRKAEGKVIVIASFQIEERPRIVRRLEMHHLPFDDLIFLPPIEIAVRACPYRKELGHYGSFLWNKVNAAELIRATHFVGHDPLLGDLFRRFLPKVIFHRPSELQPRDVPNKNPAKSRPAQKPEVVKPSSPADYSVEPDPTDLDAYSRWACFRYQPMP